VLAQPASKPAAQIDKDVLEKVDMMLSLSEIEVPAASGCGTLTLVLH
jgi:hypothetical protein